MSKDYTVYLFAESIPAALGLSLLIIFTKVFSTSDFGRYSLTIAIVYISTTIAYGWIEQSTIRFWSKDGKNILGNVYKALAAVTICFIPLSIILYFLTNSSSLSTTIYFVPAVCLVVSLGIFRTLRAAFQAKISSKSVLLYKCINAVTKFAVAIGVGVFIIENIVGWLWGAVIGTTVSSVLMIYHIGYVELSETERETFTSILKYGVPMIGWMVCLSLLNFTDRLLIEYLIDTESVGLYSANYDLINSGLPLVFTPLIRSIHPVLLKEWNAGNTLEVKTLLRGYTRYFIVLGLPITLVTCLLSKPVSMIILGPEFQEAHLVIPFIAVGLFFWNFSMLVHKPFEMREKTSAMFAFVLSCVLINLVLNLLLIPILGIIGSAVSTLIAFLFYFIISYIFSGRLLQWRFPRRTLLKTLLSLTTPLILCALMVHFFKYSLLLYSALTVVSIFLYAFVSYHLGVLSTLRKNNFSM